MFDVVAIEELEVRNRARSSLMLLCQDRVRVDLVGYGEKPPVELPLIVQLEQAAYVRGAEAASAGSSRGAGVPLDLVASEMFSTLANELHDDAVVSGAVSVYSAVDPLVDAQALLEKAVSVDVEWLGVRAGLWAGWCRRITEYLKPTRRTPIPGRCPNVECGSERWFTYDDEGSEIQDHALRAVWVDDEVDGVECACCFSFWPRHALWELAYSLDAELVLRLRSGSV